MNKKCYKFCLYKAYFEKGYGITTYLKYLIILVGLAEGFATQSLSKTFILAFVYGIACFFIGWGWYHYGLALTEQEVGNNFNLFVREMRKRYNRKI